MKDAHDKLKVFRVAEGEGVWIIMQALDAGGQDFCGAVARIGFAAVRRAALGGPLVFIGGCGDGDGGLD